MEILCPNCQRKLTILEQYAGQQMKCPLCAGTFNAPALATTPGIPTTPVNPIQLPPPVSFSPPPAPPAPIGSAAPDTYSAPAPQLDSPPPSPPVPTEHTGRFSIWISPRVCQFVPVVLLFLVFVLTWFTWVAFAPGGVYVDSQNAWQAALGSVSTDPELKSLSSVGASDKDSATAPDMFGALKAGEPGFSVVTSFWLLTFFGTFVLTAAVVAVGYGQAFLPPKVQPYLRWRWAALALVTLLSFLFLALQDSIGFNLERNAHAAIDRQARKMEETAKTATDSVSATKLVTVYRGVMDESIRRTFWFRCAFWFYFWALVFVFINMLADLRSPRPSPRIDLLF